MTDLREKIAEIIADSSIRYHDDGPLSKSDALEWADAILSLPELKEALSLPQKLTDADSAASIVGTHLTAKDATGLSGTFEMTLPDGTKKTWRA